MLKYRRPRLATEPPFTAGRLSTRAVRDAKIFSLSTFQPHTGFFTQIIISRIDASAASRREEYAMIAFFQSLRFRQKYAIIFYASSLRRS